MPIDARMNGTPLEQAHWRIRALREGLHDVMVGLEPTDAAYKIAANALACDDDNAKLSEEPSHG